MRGQVPAEPILKRLQAKLDRIPDASVRADYIRYLEASLDVGEEYIYHYLQMSERHTIPFHLADGILTALGDPSDWQSPDLYEHYLSCDIDCLDAYVRGSRTYHAKRSEVVDLCHRMRNDGCTQKKIMEETGYSRRAIQRWLKEDPCDTIKAIASSE